MTTLSALDIFIDIMILAAVPIIVIILIIVLIRGDKRKRREGLKVIRRMRSVSQEEHSQNGATNQILNYISKSDIEVLRCYSCDDVLELSEEKCSNCGAARPRCMICFQDLKPSEKVDVVQLPCCKVYVHENHMLTWLKQNMKCPNCRIDLSKWFDEL